MSTETIIKAAEAARAAIVANESEIEHLDRAIGDGDHFINIRRGADTIIALAPELDGKTPSEALKAIAMKLMSTIGGASGPLISSFFLAASKTEGIDAPWTAETVARLTEDGVAAIQKRGKAGLGHKTMLDVLIPVAEALKAGAAAGEDAAALGARVVETAAAGKDSTRDLTAHYGRAAFLGERAIGTVDPGAMSSYVIIRAIVEAR
ncbi:dihydroxyacetone kinase subunit L [Acuticoccus sp. M5D2P5]|uniref:dihydroxyacetone kinase subunit DhaL n=1 Tax=Acuticoccus kalidii TaxID=2910977 RepID=UPI001F3A8160|nr:dihydroxyacetone kinase subunit DhaL [Acuticoccus kalidii]MCF3933682.1 dihydroxyacetone kinase subunit L [Acuticoccus kalidii]